MRRRAVLVSTLIAWLLATGGQWDFVQVFAWGRMIATYSRVMPITKAVRLTFDADNMCGICRAVDDAQRQQDSTLPVAPAGKSANLLLVFRPSPLCLAATPIVTGLAPDDSPFLKGVLRSAPPVPPPRGQA